MSLTFDFATLLRDIFCYIDEGFNHEEASRKEEAKHFGIDPKYSARKFLTCIYQLEDSSYAIDDYYKFGLDGPTKHENKGETYLRLYGLLSAAYLQYLSCESFYKMYKLKDEAKFYKEAKSLKIYKARHIAAAHSVNYRRDDGEIDYYLISQVTLRGHGEEVNIIGDKDKDSNYNIKQEMKAFTSFINEELNSICFQIIQKQFDKESKIFAKFMDKLDTLERRRMGDMVLKGPNGEKIIITTGGE
jgi:hypothetical protein